jgi:hypothetical protein
MMQSACTACYPTRAVHTPHCRPQHQVFLPAEFDSNRRRSTQTAH